MSRSEELGGATHETRKEEMADRLAGKTAFITGAAQGIGRAIAEAFADEGATVVAADLRWADRPASPRIEVLTLDMADDDAVSRAFSGRSVDVLVNCVGYVAVGTVLDTDIGTMTRSFDLNVLTMVRSIRAGLPGMVERGAGSIINIASVVSSTMGAPDRFAYGTTKAAVIGLTKSVARDFIARGVRCNSISPGTTLSPSLEQRWAATGDVEAARDAFVARQPMGRIGDPAEMAAAAVLLASDEARFMTGTDVVIDGGMSL